MQIEVTPAEALLIAEALMRWDSTTLRTDLGLKPLAVRIVALLPDVGCVQPVWLTVATHALDK